MNPFAKFPALVRELGLVNPRILHVGSHKGEEMPFYREVSDSIVLVEPIPELAASLSEAHPTATVVNAAVSPLWGTLKFYVMKPTNVSTLVTPRLGDRVERTIDVDALTPQMLLDDHYGDDAPEVLVIDAQGLELSILSHFELPDEKIPLVITETCTVRDPTMASHYDDVVELMTHLGYEIVAEWKRDLVGVNRFARGVTDDTKKGEFIIDVAFHREF